MSYRQVIRVSLFALAGVLATTPVARAAGDVPATKAAAPAKPPAQTPAAPGQLAKERAALARQLDQVNAEIDKLKRAGGVRDDYRLRARLADAEALARRLIELDARLGIRADGTHAPGPEPTAAPTDSAADLDAKADILADQARRFRVQAETLAARADALKGRQELRRRASDLDRDPFAPMEGSRRRMASAAATTVSLGGGRSAADDKAGPAGVTSGPAPAVGPTSVSPPSVTTTSTGSPAPVLSGLSLQFRDLLDTATLADIRRLEGTGTPSGTSQALLRAATALRARADELDVRAKAMRPKHP
jgi:hypothetical protein